MVKISIPTLPTNVPLSLVTSITSLESAVPILESFLSAGRTTVLTGAGVSVASGIRAYRGPTGR